MEDSQEIDEILFEAAADIDTPELREDFFDLIREGDPTRSERLRALFAVTARANRFFRKAAGARTVVATEAGDALIEAAGFAEADAPASEDASGDRIGRYRLEKRIGEGGCGVVYLAEQVEPVQRQVALKVIRLGMDTERVIGRFEMERQSLALMDHPNIARVLDAGATDSGRPYFVMEWVRGSRITDYCDEQRLSILQRINLFIEVCNGIQHAHQKGVIHRDIKPSNILIAVDGGKPTPKVIDFGVAKAISSDPGPATALTSADQFVGTPAYMSPEQADRRERDIDTRSDVYSLGVLLYELLVGRAPFDSAELSAAGLMEMRRILVEREPAPPSATLAGMNPEEREESAARRHTEPGRLLATVRGDLDSVVMKAIEKERQWRYETVNGLVMDLQRYLSHEPVFARPRKRMYLIGKFVRRNRLAVSAAAAILVSLVLGLGTASAYYLRERKAREEQARLRRVAEHAHQAEMRRHAEALEWENFAQASVLLSEGKTQEADEQLRNTPLTSIQLTPRSATLLRSLGNWNALRGRWQQAAECFQMLVKADETNREEHLTNTLDLIAVTCATIEKGDRGQLDAVRNWAMDRVTEDPTMRDTSRLFHSVLLVPADRSLLARLDPLKSKLANSDFDHEGLTGVEREYAIWRAFGLALLEYRQGNYEQARHWTELALRFKAGRDYINGALEPVHAMVCFQLGEVETARSLLPRMRQRIDKAFAPELPAAYEPFGEYQGFWWDWIIARLLLREAEELIEGSAAAPRSQ